MASPMSDALRIATVVEGPTDRIVLQAIVRALLPTIAVLDALPDDTRTSVILKAP